jgi:hypothetical protein
LSPPNFCFWLIIQRFYLNNKRLELILVVLNSFSQFYPQSALVSNFYPPWTYYCGYPRIYPRIFASAQGSSYSFFLMPCIWVITVLDVLLFATFNLAYIRRAGGKEVNKTHTELPVPSTAIQNKVSPFHAQHEQCARGNWHVNICISLPRFHPVAYLNLYNEN